MRTLKLTGALMVLLLMLAGISSCSEDDAPSQENQEENSNNENNNSEDKNTPPELEPYIGIWSRESGYNYPTAWTFYADKTCEGSFSGGVGKGEWDYVPDEKILSTTVNGWQYHITLKTESSWAGVSLGSDSKTAAFYRDNNWKNKFALSIILHFNWYDEQGNLLSFGTERQSNKWSAQYYILNYTNKQTNLNDWYYCSYEILEKDESTDYQGVKVYITNTEKELAIGWERYAKSFILTPAIYSSQPEIELNGIRFTGKSPVIRH